MVAAIPCGQVTKQGSHRSKYVCLNGQHLAGNFLRHKGSSDDESIEASLPGMVEKGYTERQVRRLQIGIVEPEARRHKNPVININGAASLRYFS